MHAIDIPQRGDGHAAPITSIACRGRRLATCSYDGTVIVWHLAGDRLVQEHRVRHRRLVNGAAWHPSDPDVLATASADKTVAVWRVGAGGIDLVAVLARHTDDVNAVAWLPDGRRLVAVSEDGSASLWDAMEGRFLGVVARHAGHCMMTSVSTGGVVATVGEDGMVQAGHPDQPSTAARRTFDASIEGCAWSPDGHVLALARDDGRLELVDPSLQTVRSVAVGSSAVRSLAWLADGRRMVVGSYDGAVRLADRDGNVLRTFRDERVWPRSVAAGDDYVAAGSFWATPFVLDPETGKALVEPTTPTEAPNTVAVAGGRLHVGLDSGAVVSVPVASVVAGSAAGATVERPSRSPVLSVAEDGGRLFVGTYAGSVITIGPDGTHDAVTHLGAPVPSLAAAGGRLFAGTYNGDVVELDPRDLSVVVSHRAHEGSVKSLALVDGLGLLSAATDGRVAAGDGCTGRQVLWEHGNLVNAVAAGAGIVASASRDHTVLAGRVHRDGDRWVVGERWSLLGADESMKCVAVVADGDGPVVVAGSYDFDVYGWRLADAGAPSRLQAGRAVHTFTQAACAAVAVDASTAVVASWDHRLAVVSAGPQGPVVTTTVAVGDLLERR